MGCHLTLPFSLWGVVIGREGPDLGWPIKRLKILGPSEFSGRACDSRGTIVFSVIDMDVGGGSSLSFYWGWKPKDGANLELLGTSFPSYGESLSEDKDFTMIEFEDTLFLFFLI